MEKTEDIADRAFAVFHTGIDEPRMTLRAGNSVDEYSEPPAYDPNLDKPTDEYLEQYFWGLPHLDPESWRYYLPYLIDLAMRNVEDSSSSAVDAMLNSLRPPDRDPARFATLTQAQEKVIVVVLDVLAFDERSAWKEEALQVLEEYWVPNALYRDNTSRDP